MYATGVIFVALAVAAAQAGLLAPAPVAYSAPAVHYAAAAPAVAAYSAPVAYAAAPYAAYGYAAPAAVAYSGAVQENSVVAGPSGTITSTRTGPGAVVAPYAAVW